MRTHQPPTDIPLRIRADRAALAPAEQRIADHILADPAGAVGQTFSEPATACNTSETTVVRFSRAVGRRGHPDLRMALATGLAHEAVRERHRPVPGTDIGPDGTLRKLFDKIGYADARGVEETIENLDLDRLEQLAAAITTARRINLLGVGASGFTPCDLQPGSTGSDCPLRTSRTSTRRRPRPGWSGDVYIGVSHSGTTPETVRVLGLARRRGRGPHHAGPRIGTALGRDGRPRRPTRPRGLRPDRRGAAHPHQTEAAPRATFDAVRDVRMEGQPRR